MHVSTGSFFEDSQYLLDSLARDGARNTRAGSALHDIPVRIPFHRERGPILVSEQLRITGTEDVPLFRKR